VVNNRLQTADLIEACINREKTRERLANLGQFRLSDLIIGNTKVNQTFNHGGRPDSDQLV